MKIVFSTHLSSWEGGAQKCLLDLIKGIKRWYPETQIYLILPGKSNQIDLLLPYIEEFKIVKQSWWILNSSAKKKRLLLLRHLLKYSWKTSRYLKRIKPDVVVTNTIVSPTVALASKIGGFKHVWFVHEVPMHTGFYKYAFNEKLVMKLVGFTTSKMLVVSEYTEAYYRSFFNSSTNIVSKINVAVDISVDLCEKVDDGFLNILFVGNFDSNKNQMEAVNACALLKKRGVSFHLYLVGATEKNAYVELVRSQVSNGNLNSDVSIIGFSENIGKFYQKADVLVLCSATEAKPRVVIEAQKYGIPVVVTLIEAHKELVKDGYNGFVYERGSVELLADKLQKLVDVKLRQEMGQNAFCFMKDKFQVKGFVDEFMRYIV